MKFLLDIRLWGDLAKERKNLLVLTCTERGDADVANTDILVTNYTLTYTRTGDLNDMNYTRTLTLTTTFIITSTTALRPQYPALPKWGPLLLS